MTTIVRTGRKGSSSRFLLLALLLGCGEERSSALPEGTRPNVILVTLDTTRVDRFSSYGHPLPLTENFDSLAEEGVRFEHAQVCASLTPVSHATILTGLLPYDHGLRVLIADGADRLPDDVPTLATVLGKAGWSTAAFLSAYPVSERYGFTRGFDVYDSGVVTERDPDQAHRQRPHERRSDLTTERILAWLEDVQEPYFLWIHYWDSHDSKLVPPSDSQTSYRELARAEGVHANIYDSEVRYVDTQFGLLLDALRAKDHYDKTLFCITADHGQGLGDHDWFGHRLLYEEQIHVPLILRWPGGPAGRSVSALVGTEDIFPTILELVDVGMSKPVGGRSLMPLIDGTENGPRSTYAESIVRWDAKNSLMTYRPDDDLLHMECDGRYKLIYKPSHPERSELYDLDADPKEVRNLYTQRTEVAQRLLTQLQARNAFQMTAFSEGPLDQAAADALSEIGYVDSEDEGEGE